MADIIYGSAERIDDWIRLDDDASDNVAYIPIAAIEKVAVNWLVKNGKLEIFTSRTATTVIFDEGDHGEACGIALAAITHGQEEP